VEGYECKLVKSWVEWMGGMKGRKPKFHIGERLGEGRSDELKEFLKERLYGIFLLSLRSSVLIAPRPHLSIPF